jgi:hypothetical protein
MPGAGAVHHIKTGKSQNEQKISALPQNPNIGAFVRAARECRCRRIFAALV